METYDRKLFEYEKELKVAKLIDKYCEYYGEAERAKESQRQKI